MNSSFRNDTHKFLFTTNSCAQHTYLNMFMKNFTKGSKDRIIIKYTSWYPSKFEAKINILRHI